MLRGGRRWRLGTSKCLLIGLGGITMFLLSLGCADDHAEREAQLVAEIDSLEAHISDMNEDQVALKLKMLRIVIPDRYIRGLSLVEIANDLRDHPELIPLNPVPERHSKLRFYDHDGIYFLSKVWAMADFGDGHNSGRMLLRFWVDDSGEITWKVLSWTMLPSPLDDMDSLAVGVDMNFDKPPVPVRTVEPEYPAQARREKIEGVVNVCVWISASGEIDSATVVNEDAPRELCEAAVKAALEWRFKPATKNGVPVAVRYILPIGFSLDRYEQRH